jgi:hypothetical protein
MKKDTSLRELQRKLEAQYAHYTAGLISEEEYLRRIKPIDEAIDSLEMAIFWDTPIWEKRLSSSLG